MVVATAPTFQDTQKDLVKEFRDYVRTTNELYLPYVAEKFGISLKECCVLIEGCWSMFRRPRMVDNLLITDYPKEPWWFEVCNTPYKRGQYVPANVIQDYWTNNQKQDQHFSVFAHDKQWKDNVDESGGVSCNGTKLFAPWIWIEMDRKDYNKNPDFQKAITDAIFLTKQLGDQAVAFTSGNNSTHVLISGELFGFPIVSQENRNIFSRIAHRIAGNLRFGVGENNVQIYNEEELREHFKRCYPHTTIVDNKSGDLPADVFSWDRDKAIGATENIDQNIYRTNSLIRQPWSYHEKKNHQKKLLTLDGTFDYSVQKISFPRTTPKFLEMWYEEWDRKENFKKNLASPVNSSYIINRYKKYYPDIEHMTPSTSGLYGPFYSIFYEDTNPSVYISSQTGYYKDFGSNRFSMNMDQFLVSADNG